MLIIPDKQIKEETWLEQLNLLAKHAWIPGLLGSEEIGQIVVQLSEENTDTGQKMVEIINKIKLLII